MTQKIKAAFIIAAASIVILLLLVTLYVGKKVKSGGVFSSGEKVEEVEIGDIIIEEEKDEPEETGSTDNKIVVTAGTEETFQDTSPEAEVEQGSLTERLSAIEGLSLDHDTGYIFVGDSRFVHMNDVCKISDTENLFMVAKVGEGYSWFTQTAMQQIKRIISTGLYSKWKIIICLGVNDLGDLSKYVQKYEQLKNDYDISLVSVNPITSYGSLDNKQIDRFNNGIKDLGIPYIDTYRLLMVTGFTTTDGLHYNAETSDKIFRGILLGLKDEDSECLVKDPANVLSQSALGTKKSLQREILAQNKYVPKPAATPAASANKAVPVPEEIVTPPVEEPLPGELTEPPRGEDGQIDQDYLDQLYGIKRDEDGNVIEEEGEKQEESEPEPEEEHREEEEEE